MTPPTLARLDLVQKLVLVAIVLGLVHHADHVARADHSSWPFRPEVGPFTFTLLIYPVLLVVLLARRHWLRVVGLGLVSLFALLAHTLVEPPQQIYGTWANNRSTPATLYSVDPEHIHNLFDVESPLLGILATILTITLTALLLFAWAVAIRSHRHRQTRGPRGEVDRRDRAGCRCQPPPAVLLDDVERVLLVGLRRGARPPGPARVRGVGEVVLRSPAPASAGRSTGPSAPAPPGRCRSTELEHLWIRRLAAVVTAGTEVRQRPEPAAPVAAFTHATSDRRR